MIAQAATIRLPKLYPKQRAALFTPKRYAVVEASTKSGKTVGCMAWIIAEAVRTGQEGRNYWWVAPIYTQAKIAYRRIRRMLRKADPNQDFWSENKTELTITLANGAVLWFKGADDPDSLYGEDVYAAVIDEATRCKEDAWYAIRSTLTATRGPVRIIGNVKGRKNWAYNFARKAESGSYAEMSYAKITAYDAVEAGVLAAEEIEDAKSQLPDQVFRELYLAEPSEDGGNPFGIQEIRACISDELAPGPVAYWGVDLATKIDWTVAIGGNNRGEVCAYHRWRTDWRNTGMRLKAMIGTTPGMIDATGVGAGTSEDVCRTCRNVEPVIITKPRKQELMGHVAYAIHNRTTAYPREIKRLDGTTEQCQIVPELESMEYEVRVTDGRVSNIVWSAPPGLHDDCIIGLGLMLMYRATAPRPMTLSGVTVSAGPEVDTFASDYNPLEDERLWQ